MLNYSHNKMALLYGENRPRKLVKRALGENDDDFLSYALAVCRPFRGFFRVFTARVRFFLRCNHVPGKTTRVS